jgi:L-asparaginase / beta-aspartyl-peptidase
MHLNQFYHVECEFLGSFSVGISVAEKYIINLVSTFLRGYEEHILASAGTTDHLKTLLDQYRSNSGKFPQVTLNDALNPPEIHSGCWKYVVPSDPGKGRAITRAGELKLIEHFGGIVWLTEMDHLTVPFYQAYSDETCAKARCADLLLGNGEVLGLGKRHMLSKDVMTALRKHEVPMGPYAWYMQMRDTKPALTTGWGMGVERFLAWILQHDDIAIWPLFLG